MGNSRTLIQAVAVVNVLNDDTDEMKGSSLHRNTSPGLRPSLPIAWRSMRGLLRGS